MLQHEDGLGVGAGLQHDVAVGALAGLGAGDVHADRLGDLGLGGDVQVESLGGVLGADGGGTVSRLQDRVPRGGILAQEETATDSGAVT